jgi:hypothetical protein
MMKIRTRILLISIATVVISLCTVNSAVAVSVNPEQADDKALEENGSAWDAAGEGSTEAWEKTKEASSDIWEATKQSSAEAWEATKEFSSNAWEATKRGSTKAWDSTTDWLNGTDAPPADSTLEDEEPAPADSGNHEAAGDSLEL